MAKNFQQKLTEALDGLNQPPAESVEQVAERVARRLQKEFGSDGWGTNYYPLDETELLELWDSYPDAPHAGSPDLEQWLYDMGSEQLQTRSERNYENRISDGGGPPSPDAAWMDKFGPQGSHRHRGPWA